MMIRMVTSNLEALDYSILLIGPNMLILVFFPTHINKQIKFGQLIHTVSTNSNILKQLKLKSCLSGIVW